LIDKINQAEYDKPALSGEERFKIIDCIISNMSKGNKLNIILYDGEYMYVHTNYRDSLFYLQKEGEIFFSTQPLSEEDWKLVPFTRLLAYKEGQKVFEGTNHQNEYIDSEENMNMIYQIFSEL
jgi:glutamine amidotransferase